MASRAPACPQCGFDEVKFADYDSMIVVTADFALFTFACPRCGFRASTLRLIPGELRDEVSCAAIEVGAGMGRVG